MLTWGDSNPAPPAFQSSAEALSYSSPTTLVILSYTQYVFIWSNTFYWFVNCLIDRHSGLVWPRGLRHQFQLMALIFQINDPARLLAEVWAWILLGVTCMPLSGFYQVWTFPCRDIIMFHALIRAHVLKPIFYSNTHIRTHMHKAPSVA